MVKALAAVLLLVVPVAQAFPKPAGAAASDQPTTSLPAAPMPKNAATGTTGATNAQPGAYLADNAAAGAQNSQELGAIRLPELPPAKYIRIAGVEKVPSRKAWLILSIADHSSAAFDAYSTRAAISRGASEADPLIRPFAGSDGLYAAIQVAPLALDYIARRMQGSQNRVLRHTWWLPQTASTGLFLFAGAHNMTVAGR